jgi:hypothetical protein
MEARVDDEDVALLHLHAVLDLLGRVDVVGAGRVREIHDDALVHQEVEVELGDVLARRVEVDLTVQVGPDVVRVGQELPVGAVRREPLEVLHLQRLVGRPGRRADADRDGELDGFHGSTSGTLGS